MTVVGRHQDAPYSNGTGTKENIRYLEEALVRLDKRLDGIDSKLSYIGRANWQVILSTVGVSLLVVGGLWGLTVAPINSEVARTERNLRNIEAQVGVDGLSLVGIRVELQHITEAHRLFREHLRQIENERVSIKEYNIALAASIAQRDGLQRNIDVMNKKIDEVFPPQKTLEDLTRRLAELERTRNTIIHAPPPLK